MGINGALCQLREFELNGRDFVNRGNRVDSGYAGFRAYRLGMVNRNLATFHITQPDSSDFS